MAKPRLHSDGRYRWKVLHYWNKYGNTGTDIIIRTTIYIKEIKELLPPVALLENSPLLKMPNTVAHARKRHKILKVMMIIC